MVISHAGLLRISLTNVHTLLLLQPDPELSTQPQLLKGQCYAAFSSSSLSHPTRNGKHIPQSNVNLADLHSRNRKSLQLEFSLSSK